MKTLFGNFLLLFALYGVFATFGPALVYEAQYRLIQVRGITFEVQEKTPLRQDSASQAKETRVQENQGGFAQVLAGDKQQILMPKDTEFSISIPKIGASAKVFPNVDPTSPNDFLPVLSQGIAHAKGTVFPGMQGNIYLFAHSTDNWWNVGRYNAVFYLLQHIGAGDEIVVFFGGKRFEYVVSQTMISDPKDISLLTQAHGGEERLILQTCWPPGTTWKRLYVIAVPK